jgi:antitoxin ParD1/3/4
MRTRNVSLTDALDQAVEQRVKSGAYENASEVIRAALRALDLVERENAAKLPALRKALADGEASGTYPGDPFAAVRREFGLPKRTSKRKRG